MTYQFTTDLQIKSANQIVCSISGDKVAFSITLHHRQGLEKGLDLKNPLKSIFSIYNLKEKNGMYLTVSGIRIVCFTTNRMLVQNTLLVKDQ